jgi:hypothetical protein
MAVVFLEEGLSPIPMRMASTKLYRDPRRSVCQSAIVEGRDLQKTNRNLLRNLTFHRRTTARLTTIKNN